MRQEGWTSVSNFKKQAHIYQINTKWLQPLGNTIFYIGVTEDISKRAQEHREKVYNIWKNKTPDDFMKDFSNYELFKEQRLSLYENLRKGIIAASRHHGYDINVKKIDTIKNREEYRKKLEALSPVARMKISINQKASPFTLAALEKERRWIFHLLQGGYLLANVENLFEGTIEALQKKEIDVLGTSFASPDWNPIIKAYFQDKETLNNYGLQIN